MTVAQPCVFLMPLNVRVAMVNFMSVYAHTHFFKRNFQMNFLP